MKARITKAFKFAIGGIRVVDVNVGDIVDGRCAEVAIQEKWGVLLEAVTVLVPPPPPAILPEPATVAQPEPKPAPPAVKASKHKGR